MSDEKIRLPVVCKKLRTKHAFGSPAPGAPDWRLGQSSTAAYWCLCTMETWGRDEGVAHPHRCVAGRACFEAPVGEEIA